jgi:signal transduction histidine kinase
MDPGVVAASSAPLDGAAVLDADLQARIEAERAAALYGKGSFPYLGNMLVAVVEVAAVAPLVEALPRFGWLALMTAVTVARFGLWGWHRVRPDRFSPRRWCELYAAGGTVNGLVWGATAFFLWAPGAAHHALLGFVVGGMVAGSTAVVPAYLPAFYLFAVTTLTPLTLRLLVSGAPSDMAMGALLALFGLNMTKLARGAGQWFTENTQLKLHELQLVERLSEARDQLELRVAERTAELGEKVAQLGQAEGRAREAVRVRNDFMAIASHELRTPLATLELHVGRLEWLMQQPGGLDPAALPDSVRALRRQVRRLAGLVDTVLTASGLAQQGMVLAPVEMDLAAAVRAVVADVTAHAAVRPPPVTLALEEPLVGRWDPGRVEQVIANLLSNALKYGAGAPVRIEVAAGDGEAVLTVRDGGPGIPAPQQARIFERFFRADVGGQAAGLGLGLAVVRELVEAMKGTITVDSAPGRGAAFTVRLPREG